MKTTMSINNHIERLLGTLDFEELLESIVFLLDSHLSPQAIAILVWDPDLESFVDRKFFGPLGEFLKKPADILASELEKELDFQSPVCVALEKDKYAVSQELEKVFAWRIQDKNNFAACILLACTKDISAESLPEHFAEYPFLRALQNGWEVRELKRENERLRSRYDDLEERNSNLEEQTRKLIQDLRFKDGLRYRNIEQEKLIYQISSIVRSSVEIQKVLQTAVTNVGEKCLLSRCIILRKSTTSNDLFVYEYHNDSSSASQDLFFAEPGQEFFKTAITKTAPCDLVLSDLEAKHGFDPSFLKQFGFVSALLVPLLIHDRSLGCLFVQDCVNQRLWSIEDLTFFGAIADQLSVAVENADLHEEKKLQAVTDGLTGLSNRRHFNDVFQREFERAKRYVEPLSLAVFDLDYLKVINDTYGHTAGDSAIKAVAQVLSSSSRTVDLAARYGGEEFCLLLPNTPLEDSVIIAERIRKLINKISITGSGNISTSVGLASFPLHANSPDELFQRADEALYTAKQTGRNKLCIGDNA